MIELIPCVLSEDYAKTWNVSDGRKFSKIYCNGKKVSDTLVSVGGLGGFNPKFKYSTLLFYYENYYEDYVTTIEEEKRNLAVGECIVDNSNGEILYTFKGINYPRIIGDCIYEIKNKFYNIKTGDLYLETYSYIISKHSLILHHEYTFGGKNVNKKLGFYRITFEDGKMEYLK